MALIMISLSACIDSSTSADSSVESVQSAPAGVSALGRLEPQRGVMRISSASVPDAASGAILSQLLVDVGDDVTQGQLLAVTDAAPVLEARLEETQTELTLAEQEARAARSSADATCVRAGVLDREAKRLTELRRKNLAAEEDTDRARGSAEASAADCVAGKSAAEVAKSAIEVARAKLRRQQAEFNRAHVHSPVDGRVLAVNTRPGELVGVDGILELGRVDAMYAIAEVYETDVSRLRLGQRATIASPALPEPLTGQIEIIHPMVRKQDEIGTDPAARKDARIVEVEVLLDDPDSAKSLTYLQVDVVFDP